MYTVIVVLHVLVGLMIIGVVLLQSGKGADIGSAFGGGGSQAVFGSMSTPTLLGKITGAVAIVFVLTSFVLVILHGKPSCSVMTQPPGATAPAPPAGQK